MMRLLITGGRADMIAKAEAAGLPVWKTGGWPGE